ncbi:MAG TPA: hypothetical protein VGQ91_10840 [Ideonella sp.]|jgi:hypothetical protein|nr:hypothetical protein [Ideonella sp.]
MTRLTPHALLATLGLALACGAAQANNYSKAVYDKAKDDVKATYKAERDNCGKLSGNAKDICVEEAKGRENIALAQLDYNNTGKADEQMKLAEATYEARYAVAKERCDDLAGDKKDVCTQEAKTTYEKAKADAKANKKIADARSDAEKTKMKADYKLAKERCDTLAGDAKDSCIASAKARYNES